MKTLTSFAGFALLFPVVALAGDEAHATLDLTSHTVGLTGPAFKQGLNYVECDEKYLEDHG